MNTSFKELEGNIIVFYDTDSVKENGYYVSNYEIVKPDGNIRIQFKEKNMFHNVGRIYMLEEKGVLFLGKVLSGGTL